MSIRERFVAEFGEEEALCLERAARKHQYGEGENPIHRLTSVIMGEEQKTAKDQFLLDIAWCISWECLSRDSFFAWHGFKADKEHLREWITTNAVPPPEYRDPLSTSLYAAYLLENVTV